MGQSGQEILLNKVEPEPAKLEQVKLVEAEFKRRYPCLHRRLGDNAEAFVNPQDVMSLVSETVDCLLQRLAPHKSKRAIFLVGSSGSGKSTFANWLLGSEVVLKMEEDEHGDKVPVLTVSPESFKVGHGLESKTLVPNVREVPSLSDTILVDFPGFKDTTSLEIRLGIDVAFREACKLFKSVHVLALISISALQDERGSGFKAQLSKLVRLLPTEGMPLGAKETASSDEACVWWMGITKCDDPFVFAPTRKFREAEQLLRKQGFHCKVVNINHMMMRSGVAATCQHLCEETHLQVSTAMDGAFKEAFTSAFGAVPDVPKALLTDCLSSHDCAKFQKFFMTTEWTKQFGTNPPCIEATPVSEMSFAQARALLHRNGEAVREFVDEIQKDAHAMVEGRALGMQRRNEHVKTLCGYQQCRLKKVFLSAERVALDEYRAAITSVVEELAASTRGMEEGHCITSGQRGEVLSVLSRINKALSSEGYVSTDHHRAILAAARGVLMAFPTTVVWAAGDPTNPVAVKVAVWVAGVVVGLAAFLWDWYQKRTIAAELIQASHRLWDAFASITEHMHKFEAMKKDLDALEILESD